MNKDEILRAVRADPFHISCIGNTFMTTMDPVDYGEVCLVAVKLNACVLSHVKRHQLLNDKVYEEICYAAIRKYGRTISYIKEPFNSKIYHDLFLEAVKSYGSSICYLKSRILQNKKAYQEISFNAVKQDSDAFMYVKRNKHTKESYRELCLYAVKSDGKNLVYMDRFTKYDIIFYRELCHVAVQQSGRALQYVDKYMFSEYMTFYWDICREAVKQHGPSIIFVTLNDNEDLNIYRDLCYIAIKSNYRAFKNIQENKLYLQICIDAIRQHPCRVSYFYNYIKVPIRKQLNTLFITDICIAFRPLRLPSYVLLAIIDYVLEDNTLKHIQKIEQIIRINESKN